MKINRCGSNPWVFTIDKCGFLWKKKIFSSIIWLPKGNLREQDQQFTHTMSLNEIRSDCLCHANATPPFCLQIRWFWGWTHDSSVSLDSHNMPCTWFLEGITILWLDACEMANWWWHGACEAHLALKNNQSVHGMESHFLFLLVSASVILGLMNFWNHSTFGNGGMVGGSIHNQSLTHEKGISTSVFGTYIRVYKLLGRC